MATPLVFDAPKVSIPDEILADLRDGHEVIRDPIHGDIRITGLERRLIDTRAFQRLRGIKQLGPTSLVYPGAVHTRFMHSIGTVHMTQYLIDTANRNARRYNDPYIGEIGAYPTLLARLVALLHDLAHVPYGHTLEDEGALFPGEWDDEGRLRHWLSDGREVHTTIAKYMKEYGAEDLTERLIDDIPAYLTTSRDELMSLAFPFVQDLVSNTLCADLLDYSVRDATFCGLKERIGDRFTQYVSVVQCEPVNHGDSKDEGAYRVSSLPHARGRVVLLGYRFETGHSPATPPRAVTKRSAMSEAVDLLRQRYALAEKVYFHRTKIALSSVLISAVRECGISASDLYEMTDEQLIAELLGTHLSPEDKTRRSDRCVNLAQAVFDRTVYREVYRLGFRKDFDSPEAHRLSALTEQLRDPAHRNQLERAIEDDLDLAKGAVSVYCPDPEMNLKRFQMLVRPHPLADIRKYEDLEDAERLAEVDALNRRYRQLWAIRVFVHPIPLDLDLARAERIRTLCADAQYFGFSSDDAPPPNERVKLLVEREAAELQREGIEILHSRFNNVLEAAAQFRHNDSEELIGFIREQLRVRPD